MNVLEVTSSADAREFLDMAVRLYQNEEHWIRPIDEDIEGLFDPKTNKLFRKGAKAKRWLLLDDAGKTIGRIAAFTNPKWKDKQPTGGVGFFECIDNQAAAFKLFDTAKAWLEEQGMEAMDGPVNFGERDKWWGLLVDGFTPPNYNMTWNFPYYQAFFEQYGFQVYFKQYTYMRPVKGVDFDPKFHKRAAITIDDPDYEFRYLKGKELYQKFPEYFVEVYNKAWARHMGKTMALKEAQLMLKKLKPVVDEKLIYFGFYKGKPISFFISIPELNQIFKYVGGKMN